MICECGAELEIETIWVKGCDIQVIYCPKEKKIVDVEWRSE
jgi:hypothetical protein